MKFELVKLARYSGRKANIYSVFIPEFGMTLFDRFLEENIDEFQEELQDITTRLEAIGRTFGARAEYFKPNEGGGGDLLCALYDTPDLRLRVFCVRESTNLVLLGGGGPKNVRAWQDDPKLTEEAKRMIAISKLIGQRIRDGELKADYDYEGNLKFFSDEEE